jgi:pyruvate formate-lyase activating enzyme-like uncharacterized protein
MKFLSYMDVMEKKIKRRRSIPGLEIDVHGHCIHIGKISYGCRGCFSSVDGGAVSLGQRCNVTCSYCFYNKNRTNREYLFELNNTFKLNKYLFNQKLRPYNISYQSCGETLQYIDDFKKFAELFKKWEERDNIEIYHHLYNNGMFATKENLKKLKDYEIDEIRFHLGASNFSKKVINNMYEASKMGFIVTVETPAWPNHKDKLWNCLPILEDIGIKHFNLIEICVTIHNINDIINTTFDYYTDEIGFYKDSALYMYDGGMVYDLIEEVLDKKYSFSVLDCNSGNRRCRATKIQGIYDDLNFYKSGFADYYGFCNRLKEPYKWDKKVTFKTKQLSEGIE